MVRLIMVIVFMDFNRHNPNIMVVFNIKLVKNMIIEVMQEAM